MADQGSNGTMPALQQLLAGNGFANSGWEGLAEQAGDPVAKQHAALMSRYEEATKIAAAFMTPAGRVALAKLREVTIDQPTWPAEGRGGFYDAAAYGFAREGQNSIIRHIEACIELAEKGPPIMPGSEEPQKKGKAKRTISTT